MEQIRKHLTENWMQLRLHIISPKMYCDVIRVMLGQRSFTKEHLPPEATWIFNWLRQKATAKKFRPSKITAPFNYDIANAAKHYANGPTYAFVAKNVKVKKHSGQWGLSNLIRKNSKHTHFPQILTEKSFWQIKHSTPLSWMMFHQSVQKH